MKAYISITLATLFVCPALAQDIPTPLILKNNFIQKINPVGKDVVAQDIAGNAIIYNIESGKEYWYAAYYPGNGNCLANNGLLVGQDLETSRAAIMKDGIPEIPKVFNSVLMSTLNGITPDGTRACGWIQNAKSGPMDIPFYCEISEDGTISEPIILPYPSKDFFNDTPQFCTASSISNDGKTIAGIVLDASGFFSYPIVYKQDESGIWNYSCPSEPLFNPDKLPIPTFPDFNNLDLPNQPDVTKYMTPEKKAEWEADMAAYEADETPVNPWTDVTYYTGEVGYLDYLEAITEYNQEVNELIGQLIDQYWIDMNKVGQNTRFIPNMALSPSGDTLIIDLGLSDDEYATDDYSGFITYKFDLSKGTYCIIESETYQDLIPTQILPDGTYISVSSPSSETPYNAFILLPEANDYISFYEYMEKTNPGYLTWMNENLNTLGTGVISGIVSFNDDKSVIACGSPFGEMMSYIFTEAKASVKGIELIEAEKYTVYNLSGIKLLETQDKADLQNLPKGIYIINGKKIKI